MTSLAAAAWPAVQASPRRALLVPVGSCEQHGPHLPLDTDTQIATAVARAAAAGEEGVYVAPALAIGASGEHGDFPGTLSIGSAALETVVVELARHASRDWPCVLLVNGHGGNVDALDRATALVTREGRRCRAWTACWPGGDAHAGRIETSLMLAIAPATVRLEAAEAGETRPIGELMPSLRRVGVRAVARNGVLGDPAGASEIEGHELLSGLAGSCREALRALEATS